MGWASPRGLGNEHGTIMLGRILYCCCQYGWEGTEYADINRTKSDTGMHRPPQPRHLLLSPVLFLVVYVDYIRKVLAYLALPFPLLFPPPSL